MIRRRLAAAGDEGFTLIELLVVCTLTVVVGAIAANAMITGMATTQRQSSRTEALNEVKKTFERVTRDVRGANPLITAQGDELKVREEHDGIRRTTRYYLDGDHLVSFVERSNISTGASLGDSTSVVLRDIDVPADHQIFRYFDSSGDELEANAGGYYSTGATAIVELDLSVHLARSDDTVDLSERITLRNPED